MTDYLVQIKLIARSDETDEEVKEKVRTVLETKLPEVNIELMRIHKLEVS